MFDDVLGKGGWLIGRGPFTGLLAPLVTYHDLDAAALTTFRAAVAQWLREHNAAAVLVRPDRYVFATGDPAALSHAWSSALAGPSALRDAA